jgi:hypothetical protein
VRGELLSLVSPFDQRLSAFISGWSLINNARPNHPIDPDLQ